jgi:hypothetical protein
MANGIEKKKKQGVGAEFSKLKMPVRRQTAGVAAPLPVAEDPLATIKNVASIVASVKGGAAPPAGAPPQGPELTVAGQTAPRPEDVGTTPIEPRGVIEREPIRGVQQTAPSPTAQRVSPEVFDATGKVIGARGAGGVITPPAEPAVKSAGVSEAPQPATMEEVTQKIAEREKKEPGFFEGLGKEGQQALIDAALTAGTSILEAADPFGAFTQVSRGVLEGRKAFKGAKAAGAKGRAEAAKERRVEAGEEREKTRLALEERRVRVAERPKGVKESETAEGRIKKAESAASEAIRKEGGTIAEQLAAAEQARSVQTFIEGRGVVTAPEVPEEKPGFFARTFGGAEGRPAVPPRISFPRRVSETQRKVRQGVENKAVSAKPSFRDFL